MNTIVLILNLIPAIIKAILAIEAAIPAGGKGADKLEAIRESLEIADSTIVSIWPKVQGVIGVLVNLLNKTGAMPSAGA